MTFKPDEILYYDHALRVRFVRDLGAGKAIVKVGPDSRIVEIGHLSREEA